jgi:hypothetical protein
MGCAEAGWSGRYWAGCGKGWQAAGSQAAGCQALIILITVRVCPTRGRTRMSSVREGSPAAARRCGGSPPCCGLGRRTAPPMGVLECQGTRHNPFRLLLCISRDFQRHRLSLLHVPFPRLACAILEWCAPPALASACTPLPGCPLAWQPSPACCFIPPPPQAWISTLCSSVPATAWPAAASSMPR